MVKKLNYVLVSLMIFASLFIISIELSSFDEDFYHQQYTNLKVDQTIGTSIDDLMVVTNHLFDYLKDQNDDIQTTIVIKGVQQGFYNQKEIDHMVDVKVLYLNVKMVLYLMLAYIIVNVIYIVYTKDIKVFSKLYFKALLYFVIALLTLVFVAVLDFDAIWRLFHQIFFSNELWLLNPATDNLINLVPLEFFMALVAKIVINYVLMMTFVSFMIYLLKGVKNVKHSTI